MCLKVVRVEIYVFLYISSLLEYVDSVVGLNVVMLGLRLR